MFRELFKIPGTDVAIYSYGLLLVIGTLAAIWLAKVLARRRDIDPEIFVNAGLLALLAGVVGARLSHIFENWAYYTRPGVSWGELFWEMLNIRSGGLTYYGGFLLAFPALVAYAIIKKVPVRVGMDIVAPCLMVGLAFGRIGCLANGCCYGERWDGACAIRFPYYSDAYIEQVNQGIIHPPSQLFEDDGHGGVKLIAPDVAAKDPQLAPLIAREKALPVHPTEIYSAITGFLLAGLLLAFMPFNRYAGRVFALMLMIEPITRFLLEALRVEPAVWHNLSLSMVLAIPQFLLGAALWIVFGLYRPSDPQKTGARCRLAHGGGGYAAPKCFWSLATETGMLVLSSWANSDTRSSSIR